MCRLFHMFSTQDFLFSISFLNFFSFFFPRESCVVGVEEFRINLDRFHEQYSKPSMYEYIFFR